MECPRPITCCPDCLKIWTYDDRFSSKTYIRICEGCKLVIDLSEYDATTGKKLAKPLSTRYYRVIDTHGNLTLKEAPVKPEIYWTHLTTKNGVIGRAIYVATSFVIRITEWFLRHNKQLNTKYAPRTYAGPSPIRPSSSMTW